MSSEVLPLHRLPEGFLRHLDDPPRPPTFPEPSATLVLLREGNPRLEVLLLQRNPASGFIPGAWVFPGGRVDPEDGDPSALQRAAGLSSLQAQRILQPRADEPPALAYWIAAIRETFEETGVLVARGLDRGGKENPQLARAKGPAQDRLVRGESGFGRILEELGVDLDAGALTYCAYWVTPECEPRRYETRFFVTHVPGDVRVTPHQREMVDHVWITPSEALKENLAGNLPMVLPTIHTLEVLADFQAPKEAVGHFQSSEIRRRLPEPRRVDGGIRFHLGR